MVLPLRHGKPHTQVPFVSAPFRLKLHANAVYGSDKSWYLLVHTTWKPSFLNKQPLMKECVTWSLARLLPINGYFHHFFVFKRNTQGLSQESMRLNHLLLNVLLRRCTPTFCSPCPVDHHNLRKSPLFYRCVEDATQNSACLFFWLFAQFENEDNHCCRNTGNACHIVTQVVETATSCLAR